MAIKEVGKIWLAGEETIIWNFEGKKIEEECISDVVYMLKFSKKFILGLGFSGRVKPVKYGALILYDENITDDHKGGLKTPDLKIIFKYKNETKEMSAKRKVLHISSTLCVYEIAEIIIDNLLEIRLTVEIPTGNQVNTESKEEEVTSECLDEQKTLSRKIEDEKETENKKGNELKSRGKTALFQHLKNMFLSEENSDVIFKVGDQKYPAHKVIIGAWSSVFQAKMKQEMAVKNNGEVLITDCDPYIFRELLFYLYTGKSDNITKMNVFELYKVSYMYDVKELRMDCVDFIMKNLTMDNICDALSIAVGRNECDLFTHATSFFLANAKEIITTENWQKFQKEYLKEANELFKKALETK